MKSIINLYLLLFFSHQVQASGIQIFYDQDHRLALKAFHHFHSIGIPKDLLIMRKRQYPCQQTHANSFIDICFEKNEMKIIRKTDWSQKTLEPFISSRAVEEINEK